MLVQAAAPLGAECAVGALQLHHRCGHKVGVLEAHVAFEVAAVVSLVGALLTLVAAIAHLFSWLIAKKIIFYHDVLWSSVLKKVKREPSSKNLLNV